MLKRHAGRRLKHKRPIGHKWKESNEYRLRVWTMTGTREWDLSRSGKVKAERKWPKQRIIERRRKRIKRDNLLMQKWAKAEQRSYETLGNNWGQWSYLSIDLLVIIDSDFDAAYGYGMMKMWVFLSQRKQTQIVYRMLYRTYQKLTSTDEDHSQMMSRSISPICQVMRIMEVISILSPA
jgi:hypothetical protein